MKDLSSVAKFSNKANYFLAVCELVVMSFIVICMLLSPDFAVAAGLHRANEFMQKISKFGRGLAVATVVVAIMITGYKVMFNGQSISECKNWIIGALLVVCAEEIAQMLIGK